MSMVSYPKLPVHSVSARTLKSYGQLMRAHDILNPGQLVPRIGDLLTEAAVLFSLVANHEVISDVLWLRDMQLAGI